MSMEKELHKKLDQDRKINFEFLSEIPKEAFGKYRYVISKVPTKLI